MKPNSMFATTLPSYIPVYSAMDNLKEKLELMALLSLMFCILSLLCPLLLGQQYKFRDEPLFRDVAGVIDKYNHDKDDPYFGKK